MADVAATKGVGFVHVRAFVTERFGAGGWAWTMGHLLGPDRASIEAVVPMGWYPLALYARLLRAVDDVHGAGDLALLVPLGRFEADRDLTTLHRMFLRMGDPCDAMERMGESWPRFHDSGSWTVERMEDRHVRAELVDWGYVDYALCRELVGYLARTLELVGADGVRIEHTRCRGLGGGECTFDARWTGVEVVEVAVPASGIDSPAGAFAASVEHLGAVRSRGRR
jgi:hypothetical protein